MKKVAKTGKYEFEGSGKELYKAVFKTDKFVPKKKIVEVKAKIFLDKPEECGIEGSWIRRIFVS